MIATTLQYTYGIQVSKDTIELLDCTNQHFEFPNTPEGYVALSTLVTKEDLCIIEAKNNHHKDLVSFMETNQMQIATIYPLETC